MLLEKTFNKNIFPLSTQVVPLDEDSDLNIIASFDRRGKYIYTGNAKGRVSCLSNFSLFCLLLAQLLLPENCFFV